MSSQNHTEEIVMEGDTVTFMQQEQPVVRYVMPGSLFHVEFYWKPNWWIRINMFLSGFEAQWYGRED